MNYTTQQISDITGSNLIGAPDICVKNIAFDSRNIYSVTDTAFLAITSEKNSGQKYIASAVEKGIKVIISSQKAEGFGGVTWIITEDSIGFLQKLAKHHLSQQPNLTTIGITGSNGKTVVKEWLYQSLWNEFKTVKSPKSFNSQIGLPLSLLQIKPEHELGIFEAGISKPGEMSKLEEIFSPNIGVLTHIGSAHIANFTNEETLIEEKNRLFTNSEIIIFNGDNELVYNKVRDLYSSKKLISFGLKNHNDLKIVGNWKDKNQNIKISYFGEELIFPANQRDEATLSNALCVIAVLKEVGIKNADIVKKLNNLKTVEMRLESVNGVRNNLIINDSYNLDLDSLKIAFQFIQEYNKPNKTLVLTDFVEGRNSEALYSEVAKLTNEQKFSRIFLIGDEISKHLHLFEAETASFSSTKELIDSLQLNHVENSLILIKGARKFETEVIKTALELQKHDTVLEVNLNAILHNINIHKSLLKSKTKMMAMVKAYSYGLGGYEIAEFLQHHHIDYLGVAYVDEGVDLRKNGITTPIMVMNPEQHSYGTIIDYNLEPEIYSFRVLDQFFRQLQEKGFDGEFPIHIKIETGMHRLGFKEFELNELIQRLNSMNVKVRSVFSHLSTSDDASERDYVIQQVNIFKRVTDKLISGLNYTPIRHILNSSGITNYPDFQFDMVRIGIGMVGISSNPEIKKQLQRAVSFKTVISQISEVKAGESVGYSRRFKANDDTRIATIPVGYADGIPRLIGNGTGKVGINHHLVPIAGNVCMDMMMLDVKDMDVKEGEEVVIFNSNPTLEMFAEYCNTIPYEVLTSVSRRVKRIYIKK